MKSNQVIRQLVEFQLGTAVLLRRPDDQPMRLVVTGRRHQPVGLHFSDKCGRMLQWESRVEQHALWRVDADPDVVNTWVQPFTLEAHQDEHSFRYTPDRKDLLGDGRIRIVEVKDEIEAVRDALYYARLEIAKAVIATLGWSFRIEERAEVEQEPAFTVARIMHHYSRTKITPGDMMAMHEAFADRDVITLAELQATLGGGTRGLATICALAVHRLISIRPEEGLNAETEVRVLDRHA